MTPSYDTDGGGSLPGMLAGMDLPEELAALRAAIEELNWSDELVLQNPKMAKIAQ